MKKQKCIKPSVAKERSKSLGAALVEATRGRGIDHVTCGEGKVHAWRRNSGVSPRGGNRGLS